MIFAQGSCQQDSKKDLPVRTHRESPLNPVSPNQTRTAAKFLRQICHQTEFRLVSNPSEIRNYNPNLVRFNKIQKSFHHDSRQVSCQPQITWLARNQSTDNGLENIILAYF